MEEASSPVKAKVKPRPPAQHPKTIDMVVDAVSQSKSIKGVTIAAIKNFIVEKYPTANTGMLRNLIKKAILKGLDQGILVRPESSGAEMGMKGRFRVDRRRLAEINKPTKKAKAKPVEKSPKPVKKKATKSEKSPSNKSLKSPKSADKKPAKPKKLADKAEAKKKVGKNVTKPKETTKAKKSPKEKKPTKTKSQTKPEKSPKPNTKKPTATKKITKKAGKSE